MKTGIWRILAWAGGVLAVWLGMRLVLPLLLPFLLGLALALLAEPAVGFFCRRGVNRSVGAGIGVTMALCFVCMALLVMGGLLLRELSRVAGILPDLEQAAQSGISLLQGWLLGLAERTPEAIRPLMEENLAAFFSDGSAMVDQGVDFLLGLAGNILSRVPDRALMLGTGVISAYLLSAKLPRLKALVLAKLPGPRIRSLLQGLGKLRRALGGWALAQAKLMGVTLALLLGGFLLLRIAYAPVWAVIVAMVDALPVLGTGTVLIPWAGVCLLQGQTARAVGLGGLYLTVALTRSALEPRLLGRQLGLDPLVTLMAVYAGYKLGGFGGMVLAPMAAVALLQLGPNSGKTA